MTVDSERGKPGRDDGRATGAMWVDAKQAAGSRTCLVLLITTAGLVLVATVYSLRHLNLKSSLSTPYFVFFGAYGLVSSLVMLGVVPTVTLLTESRRFWHNEWSSDNTTLSSARRLIRQRVAWWSTIIGLLVVVMTPGFAAAWATSQLSVMQIVGYILATTVVSWAFACGGIFVGAIQRVTPASLVAAWLFAPVYCLAAIASFAWTSALASGEPMGGGTAVFGVPGAAVPLLLATASLGSTFNSASIASIAHEDATAGSLVRWPLLMLAASLTMFTAIYTAQSHGMATTAIMADLVFYACWLPIGASLIGTKDIGDNDRRIASPARRIYPIGLAWLLPGSTVGFFFALAVAWSHAAALIAVDCVSHTAFSWANPIVMAYLANAAFFTIFLSVTATVIHRVRRKWPSAGAATSVVVLTLAFWLAHFAPAIAAGLFRWGSLETAAVTACSTWLGAVLYLCGNIEVAGISRDQLMPTVVVSLTWIALALVTPHMFYLGRELSSSQRRDSGCLSEP